MSTSHPSPIVSVILPTYNRAELVTRAIDSVLAQDFSDLELIVIDDGSTDQTHRIVSKIKDKRLRYLYFEQNRGNYVARNEGVRTAKGKFIAHIDSDDLWLPQKVSYQYYLFQKYKHLDLIFCNFKDLNDIWGIGTDNLTRNERAFQRLQVRELERDAWEILGGFPEALLLSNIIGQPTVMLRRSTMESIGNYDEDLRGAGDFEYWWRASLRGVKFAYTTRIFLERHKDAQSLTADKVVAVTRHMQALQICEENTRASGRIELLPLFRDARYRSWHRIMLEQIRRGERREAFSAYKKSIQYKGFLYGLSVVLFSYLFSVAIGPRSVERVKGWIGPVWLDRIRKLRRATRMIAAANK
jgi:glycosyltransferase involved in cell wall biosynthesis